MKILIIRNDRLGDFVLSLPVFQAIKTYSPDIHTIALIAPGNAEFAQRINSIDEILIDDKRHLIKMIHSIIKLRPDMSVTLFSTFRIGLILFLSRIKRRIAPATKLAQIFHNVRLIQRRSTCKKREFEYNLDLLTGIDHNINPGFRKPVLAINKTERQCALAEFKKQHDIRGHFQYIAFHPGSGGSSIGNLTADEYVDVARSVSGYNEFKAVFTFGPEESDLMEEVKGKVDFDAVFHISDRGVYPFCQLISNFAMFVSTSTGTMHLAGAVNIHTMSFFGDERAASPKRWGTLSEQVKQMNVTIPFDRSSRNKVIKDIKNKLINFLESYKGSRHIEV
ncbi:MAG: glycosyltransferase family 9 protein [Nitrospiraceae bacterium]|nr:MAG: glycosyltransferase family 9 protein [Nitrospiraceae bacterium]